jgi:hypothetical protein
MVTTVMSMPRGTVDASRWIDLVEHGLLVEAERVVAAAVERACCRQAAEVTDTRQRQRDAGGRGTPTCGRRAACTWQPIGMALAQLELRDGACGPSVTIGFWPVYGVRSRIAPSMSLEIAAAASPTPMFTTIFVRRGTCVDVRVAELLTAIRRDLLAVAQPSTRDRAV